jgi:hypothetical protein
MYNIRKNTTTKLSTEETAVVARFRRRASRIFTLPPDGTNLVLF